MFRSSTIIRELVQSLARVTIFFYFFLYYNFSQALYKLPDDDRRPKHVEAIFMYIKYKI